jgi:hypothetical protein
MEADFTSCRFAAEHETVQPVGEHQQHNDSVYFEFFRPQDDGPVGGVIRVGLRPNDGYGEMSIMMPLPNGHVIFEYVRSPLALQAVDVGGSRWESGSLLIAAEQPTRHWRISCATSSARVIEDPAAFFADPGAVWRASATVGCKIDLDWEAEFPMHVLSPDGNLLPGGSEMLYGRAHYEQFGRVSGEIRIGKSLHTLSSAESFRDHSWGPRVWESAPDQDFLTAAFDDGRRIAVLCNRGDDEELSHGVMWSPAATAPVRLSAYELLYDAGSEVVPTSPIGWRLGWEDGSTIALRGAVDGCMPLKVGQRRVWLAQTFLKLIDEHGGVAKVDLSRPIERVASDTSRA